MKMNMPDAMPPPIPSAPGQPAWEAAYLLPKQGEWVEEDFLKFHTNQMAELVDGRLEILPMPTWLHQLIVRYLIRQLEQYLDAAKTGGIVLFAPLPVLLFAKTIREPDILYVSAENIPQDLSGYPTKLDLVMEVVSSGEQARRRDYVDKRSDYAQAAIKEYWIVDPEANLITVLSLKGNAYLISGEYRAGEIALSKLFPGFQVPVDQLPGQDRRRS